MEVGKNQGDALLSWPQSAGLHDFSVVDMGDQGELEQREGEEWNFSQSLPWEPGTPRYF